VHNTLWERLVGNLFGRALEPGVEPLASLIHILGGVMFGILVITLLLLIGRYFVRWGYEEITIRRGRDSLARRKDRARRLAKTREGPRGVRHRRKPEAGDGGGT